LEQLISTTVKRLQAYQTLPFSPTAGADAAKMGATDHWPPSPATNLRVGGRGAAPPPWNTLVMSSGRGVGKTFGGSANAVLLACRAVAEAAARVVSGRDWPEEITVFAAGPTWGHVTQQMLFDSDASVVSLLPEWAYDVKRSSRNTSTGFPRVVIDVPGVPSRVQVMGLSAKDPDRWRGREGAAGWWDEPAACLQAAECWRQWMQILRTSDSPLLLLTCTPNFAHPSQDLIWTLCAAADGDAQALGRMLEEFGGLLGGGAVVRRQVPSWANSKMPEVWRREQKLLADTGTPWARQEVLGELAEPSADVLIARSDQVFVPDPPRSAFRRVCLGVDPATGDGSRDEWGMVALGELVSPYLLDNGSAVRYVILGDFSLGAHPDRAVDAAAAAAARLDVTMVNMERNQGGLAMASLLQGAMAAADVDPARLETYWSQTSKGARAQVWASRMRQGTLAFAESLRGGMLSSQAAMWSPERDSRNSPDRVDAVGIAAAWMGLNEPQAQVTRGRVASAYRRRFMAPTPQRQRRSMYG
jgi:phage terminase large subunit-like protein